MIVKPQRHRAITPCLCASVAYSCRRQITDVFLVLCHAPLRERVPGKGSAAVGEEGCLPDHHSCWGMKGSCDKLWKKDSYGNDHSYHKRRRHTFHKVNHSCPLHSNGRCKGRVPGSQFPCTDHQHTPGYRQQGRRPAYNNHRHTSAWNNWSLKPPILLPERL